jgi:hypothetical protein
MDTQTSTHLSIMNFVLMQNLIVELLINMSQRGCSVQRNPTSLLSFEVYLFVRNKNDIILNACMKCHIPHKSNLTLKLSWPSHTFTSALIKRGLFVADHTRQKIKHQFYPTTVIISSEKRVYFTSYGYDCFNRNFTTTTTTKPFSSKQVGVGFELVFL